MRALKASFGPIIPKNAAEADSLLDRMERGGLDTLIFVAHYQGQAFYDSAYFPTHPKIEAGFDPFGYLIGKAHLRGMDFYAWLQPGREAYLLDDAWDIVNVPGVPGDLHWTNMSMDPARRQNIAFAEDIMGRYGVDGLQIDTIRYPGWRSDFHAEDFFDKSDIDDQVRLFHDAARAAGVKMQVNCWRTVTAGASVLQHWWDWDSITDRIMLTCYCPPGGEGILLDWMAEWESLEVRPKIVPCLSVQDFWAGPYVPKPLEQVRWEMDALRAEGYMDFGLFDHRISDEMLGLMATYDGGETMADLFDRLFPSDPSEERIAGHNLYAALVDYSCGETTRQQIINYWDLDSQAQADLNALCDGLDGLSTKAEKITFCAEFHAVYLFTEEGAKYTAKTAFKNRLGI